MGGVVEGNAPWVGGSEGGLHGCEGGGEGSMGGGGGGGAPWWTTHRRIPRCRMWLRSCSVRSRLLPSGKGGGGGGGVGGIITTRPPADPLGPERLWEWEWEWEWKREREWEWESVDCKKKNRFHSFAKKPVQVAKK